MRDIILLFTEFIFVLEVILMSSLKNKFRNVKIVHLQVAGVLLIIFLASLLLSFLLWFNNSTFVQSMQPLISDVYFEGEYKIEDGEWQPIVKGQHIPATEGDVTLRGNFHELDPEGAYVGIYRGEIPVAFYTDHVNITFYEVGCEPFVLETEDHLFGDFSCGKVWNAHTFMSESNQLIEIVVHNPHSFGNETAIDEMLEGLSLWAGIEFEKEIASSGEAQRNVGMLLMLVSIVFIGIAIFSTLIHVKSSKLIWILGLLVLFAGAYFTYSSSGISFWNNSVVTNTTVLGASMIFYMLFLSMLTVCLFKTMKKVSSIAVLVLSIADAVFFLLPIISDVLFYDTWIWWVGLQLLVDLVLAVCLVREFMASEAKMKPIYVGAFLPLASFAVDVFGTWLGIWKGGMISQYVFIILLVVAAVMVLKLIPSNINAAAKAKELEVEKVMLNSELTKTRISTMMSQIRPHFIYNTLGSIEQLCELDPKKAGELVHDFSKYLRGNFRELDNPNPIPMSQEMDHVRHYVSIENVRFPDMTFTFEMNSSDFDIPALTVQPIVENAIKHGLMKLQNGGSIRVETYENETHYCVCVVDDGVGFDTSLLLDERKHVGLRNIRERLKAMVNGSIEIESTVGVGTKVLVTIPKEEKK